MVAAVIVELAERSVTVGEDLEDREVVAAAAVTVVAGVEGDEEDTKIFCFISCSNL